MKVSDDFMGKPIKGAQDALEKRLTEAKIIASNNLGIDLKLAANGEICTKTDWIEKYQSQKGEFKGKRMITAPDIYLAGKDGSEELLKSLRNDFSWNTLITGTNIWYKEDGSGSIFHPGKEGITYVVPEIPYYKGVSILPVALSAEGAHFMRALFETEDDPIVIISTLMNLSQKPVEKILVWTPENREDVNRTVTFSYSKDKFMIDCNSGMMNGRTRSVNK